MNYSIFQSKSTFYFIIKYKYKVGLKYFYFKLYLALKHKVVLKMYLKNHNFTDFKLEIIDYATYLLYLYYIQKINKKKKWNRRKKE